MSTLRSPNGCAWDRKQTHKTLRGYLLEETYEAIEAIDRGDLDALQGELGDVLLQCVFHAQLATEARRFTIEEVAQAISDKLIRRHPHIFAPDGRKLTARERARFKASTPEAVREQWARLKAGEQAEAGEARRVLAGVPRALPALLRAHKIGSRVAAVGFDWPDMADVMGKVEEEVRELREALDESPARATEELGDFLFAIANLARKLGMDPEAALAAANDKFTHRFNQVEQTLEARGSDVHRASLDEMETAWQQIKGFEPPTAAAAPPRSGTARPGRRTRSKPRRGDRS